MSNSELNYWLSRFVLEIRKVDGSCYPPNSILSMVMGLASYIKVERKVNIDILSNSEFEEFRQVLDGQMKKLSNMGLGNLRKQAEPITDNEEEQCGNVEF
ncbi:hypothetical protein SNE40_009601 [Patella caerulea]|uniref:QRICH1-like domain-containing protein n=1 Tax=Patella caerulea TaxID=87958 RepID=A0AAN8JVS8_PATCE